MLEQMAKRTERASAAVEMGSWALKHVGQADLVNAAVHVISSNVLTSSGRGWRDGLVDQIQIAK